MPEEEYVYSNSQQQNVNQAVVKKPSRLWYLLSIFLGIIGGIVGYVIIKDRDRKMARNVLIVGLIITIIHVILLFVGVITYFGIFSPSAFIGLKSPLDNKTVISLADSSNAYSTLNVLVLDQNKFIDCTDDIVKLYKERGITIPLNVANASKICKVSIDKQVVNNDSNYVVIYTQVMPEGCTKPKQPNLLNITVNSQTNQTTASWVSGSDPSQWSSFKISEMSANAPDCATYVSILNQTLG